MRTETPVAIKLEDYTPYPFEIEHVLLEFDLDPAKTRVTAHMKVVPTSGGGDMVLDGETLTLESIKLNAKPLGEDAYTLTDKSLTLHNMPDEAATLEITSTHSPEKNTALSGLYMSGGRFCTQCESVGFRRITFYPDRPDVMSSFTVQMTADKAAYPILLSNGTPGEVIDMPGGRHMATWADPHRKPAYLFAVCAGDYDIYKDSFTTMSGKVIDLGIHVDKGQADYAAWAMDSLKRSMTWDEEKYGREYDLGVFNIVAVRDFNFGAMENKGLNIFNSAYVLADEATATDADFEAIESIVAHEYFHNWTGNRVTCRDWFQLCLKEGLTVFRDQSFSADMRSAPVQRIKDVIRLRARQFPEDAGPLAHMVRPEAYGSIDNLYTATVYEKGAEIIGMLKTMIGDEAYRKGTDLYFDRHDGQAVTIEDFYACFEEVTGRDLTQFRLWYSQPGTPRIEVAEDYNDRTGDMTLTFTQHLKDGHKDMEIPLSVGFINDNGDLISEEMVTLKEGSASTTISDFKARPYVSFNRGFAAPITVTRKMSDAAALKAIALETDAFNQWDMAQTLAKAEILRLSHDKDATPSADLTNAIAAAVQAVSKTDPAYAALLCRMPDVGELFLEETPARPVELSAARKRLQGALYSALASHINAVLNEASPAPFNPGAEQAGIRALRSAFITLQAASPHRDAPHALFALFENAPNMTEQLSTLRALAGLKGGPKSEAISAFYTQWKDNPLVIDKWFSAQAVSADAEAVTALAAHPDFDLKNPNRVRSVVGVFAAQNLAAFHAPDGSGYTAVEGIILKADKANPALAARLLSTFEQWKSLEPRARGKAEETLKRLKAADLSTNAADILSRALGE